MRNRDINPSSYCPLPWPSLLTTMLGSLFAWHCIYLCSLSPGASSWGIVKEHCTTIITCSSPLPYRASLSHKGGWKGLFLPRSYLSYVKMGKAVEEVNLVQEIRSSVLNILSLKCSWTSKGSKNRLKFTYYWKNNGWKDVLSYRVK